MPHTDEVNRHKEQTYSERRKAQAQRESWYVLGAVIIGGFIILKILM